MNDRINPKIGRRDLLRVLAVGVAAASTSACAVVEAGVFPDKRKAAWQKVLSRIAEEAYWVPLFTYAKYYAYSKDLDFTPTSDEIPQFFAAKRN